MSNPIPTPDVYHWPVLHQIDNAQVDTGHIRLHWDNGQDSRFHAMWLRDQCACPDCTHPVTREQRISLLAIDEDVQASTAALDSEGGLAVCWSDGHQSVYNPGWLYAHSGLRTPEETEIELWNRASLPEPPNFDGPAVMQDENIKLAVCEAMCRYGIARLRGLPTDDGTVEQVALEFGPVRESHFERVFNVISRPDADSNAYTSEELPAHTDMPSRETPHGLQLLHCRVNTSTGGEAIMVDGFKIAEDIRREAPEDFAILSTQPWTFANRAGETDYRWNAPLFELDSHGQLRSVRLASFLRAPLMAEFDAIEPAYRSLRRFIKMTYQPEYRMTFAYQPGDLVIFDNRRVLHARGEFDPNSGHRHLQGTYIDRDDLLSTMRMLRHRQTGQA